jgi:periplasmic protein TonB
MRTSLFLLILCVSAALPQTAGSFAPKLIHKTDPEYTKEALEAKIEGTVVLVTVIGANGVPEDIRVVKGLGYGLDEKAVQCLETWRFNPALKDGQPVPVKAQVEVTFRLPSN